MKKKQLIASILRAMRITLLPVLIIATFTGSLLANKTSAQGVLDKRVTLSVDNLEIRKVIGKLQKQTGVQFIYSSNTLGTGRKISFDVNQERLGKFIDDILKPLGIAYKIIDDQVVLFAKDEAAPPEAAPPPPAKEKNLYEEHMSSLHTSSSLNIVLAGVTGNVRDEKSEPIPGVSVRVKGSMLGSITDGDGNYLVQNIPDDGVLIFNAIGYVPQEVPVAGRKEINIVLKQDEKQLGEVVVTGFGEKRDKRRLGYAVTEVKGDDIRRTNAINPIAALQGMVPGLQVSPGTGGPQATPRFLIRGSSSLDPFKNQPLIVIDGIVMDDQVVLPNKGGEQDFGNILKNINNDDIASISVLKGGAVTALYGNRAANGVIMITTKKGFSQKGLGISFSHTQSFDKAYKLMAFQDQFGSGQTTTDFVTGPDGIPQINPATYGWGFGPPLDGRQVRDINGELMENRAISDVLGIYQTGRYINTNVGVEGGNERTTFRFSYSNTSSNGVTPHNDFKRNSFNLRATHKMSNALLLDGNVAYVRSKTLNPNRASGSNNIIYNFAFGSPQNYNTAYWKDHYIDAVNGGVNQDDPAGGLWYTLFQDEQEQIEDNFRGSLNAKVTITDWLSFEASTTANLFSTSYESRSLGRDPGYGGGSYSASTSRTLQTRMKGNFNATKKINDFELFAQIGAETNSSERSGTNVYTRGGLKIPRIYRISNSKDLPGSGELTPNKYQIVSGFFQTSVTWKEYLTLNLYGRNDWNSTLLYPDGHGNYSYFYPGADLAWVFTDAFKLPSVFTYGKLRASYVFAGNGASVYQTNTGIFKAVDGYVDRNGNTIERYEYESRTLGNLNLNPEKSQKLEIGTEMKFFTNRLGFDFTYYKQNTKNQIIPLQVPSESGVSSALINAGNIQNQGIELALYGSPVKSANFSWDVYVNYTRNRNKVISLAPGVTVVPLEGDDGIRTVAYEGGDYATMVAQYAFARYQARDAHGNAIDHPMNGKRVLSATGGFIRATNYAAGLDREPQIGSALPKFLGSLRNTFNYKEFTFSFMLDARFGGLVYSPSYNYGSQIGQTVNTLFGRTKELGGLEYTNAAGQKRDDGIIPDGVYADGTTINGLDGQQHSVGGMTYREAYDKGWVRPIRALAYYNNSFYWFNGIREQSAFENSWVSLRDISVSYDLPQGFASRIKMNALRVTLGARNVGFLYKSLPIDLNPDDLTSSGSGAAFMGGGTPYIRSMSFTVNANF
jgi:iron complex outermembrane receptor protein